MLALSHIHHRSVLRRRASVKVGLYVWIPCDNWTLCSTSVERDKARVGFCAYAHVLFVARAVVSWSGEANAKTSALYIDMFQSKNIFFLFIWTILKRRRFDLATFELTTLELSRVQPLDWNISYNHRSSNVTLRTSSQGRRTWQLSLFYLAQKTCEIFSTLLVVQHL